MDEDSQSNNRGGLHGSVSGSGLNHSYILQGSGAGGHMIIGNLEHRLSMDAATGQNPIGQTNTFNMTSGTPQRAGAGIALT